MSTALERPRPTPGVWGRDLGDEYVFYERDGDRVHVLNGTAREIFLLCDGSRNEDQIAAALQERYGIDGETARRDTAQTLQRLVELGLLRA